MRRHSGCGRSRFFQCINEEAMKKLAIFLLLAGAVTPTQAPAQAMLDTTRVSCADWLHMDDHASHIFAAWMSGWFNQKRGYTWIDLKGYQRSVDSMHAFCTENPDELVMKSLHKAVGLQ
jgi:hypothetical protein